MQWCPASVDDTPLDDIEREIREIESKPFGSRTVNDARRLDQLRRAQRAIRGRGLFGSWF